MNTTTSSSWVPATVLVGVFYAFVGTLFALPVSHVQAWRLAAWIMCAAVYVAHIVYQRVRTSSPPRSTAVHAALAVALGAFLLAASAVIHSLWVQSGNLTLLLIALVLWPVMTAVPAFLVPFQLILPNNVKVKLLLE